MSVVMLLRYGKIAFKLAIRRRTQYRFLCGTTVLLINMKRKVYIYTMKTYLYV